MNLTIYNKKHPIEFDNDTLSIDTSELKKIILSGRIFFHILKYKNVNFITYSLNTINNPLLITLLIFILGRGIKTIHESTSNLKLRINLYEIIKQFYNFIKDWKDKSIKIKLMNSIIDDLEKKIDVSNINIGSDKPVYLRTDFWFGVDSGGSVGHIAGVLNQLKTIYTSVVFFTTDQIPTVDNSIRQSKLNPTNRFWNFSELPMLVSNENFYYQLLNELKDQNPAFIYQRYSINSFLGLRIARYLNVPFILEYNGSEIWISRNWGVKLKYEKISIQIEYLNLLAANLIVVVSNPMKEELIKRGIAEKKILVNPNGVDPIKYTPDINGHEIKSKYNFNSKITIGFIGTFGPWHGAEILAEAYALLIKKNKNYKDTIHLLMIGNGVTLPLAKEIIKKNNLEDKCTFTNLIPQSEGSKYLAACDILVSPHVPNPDGSPFFGSPTKLFEYMSMGKAIVASNLDQIGEVLSDNETAILVKPGDSTELALGIEKLINNERLRQELGESARIEAMTNYTWHEHTKRIIAAIQEL